MSLLEGFCASQACEKMTAKDFMRLEKLHAKLEENFQRHDLEKYIRNNNQYHSPVQEIAGNRTLNQIVDGLRKKILLYRFQSLNFPARFAASIGEHRELLEAFRLRDHRKAESLMREHLQNQSEEQWDALRKGALDLSVFPLDYASGKVPQLSITLMPCAVTSVAQGMIWRTKPIGKKVAALMEDNGRGRHSLHDQGGI